MLKFIITKKIIPNKSQSNKINIFYNIIYVSSKRIEILKSFCDMNKQKYHYITIPLSVFYEHFDNYQKENEFMGL